VYLFGRHLIPTNDWEEISFVVGGGLHRGNTAFPKTLRARVVICNQPETSVSSLQEKISLFFHLYNEFFFFTTSHPDSFQFIVQVQALNQRIRCFGFFPNL